MEKRKIGIVFRIPFELENNFETKNEERNFIRHILGHLPEISDKENENTYTPEEKAWKIHSKNGIWHLDYMIFLGAIDSEKPRINLNTLNFLMTKGLLILNKSRYISKTGEGHISSFEF